MSSERHLVESEKINLLIEEVFQNRASGQEILVVRLLSTSTSCLGKVQVPVFFLNLWSDGLCKESSWSISAHPLIKFCHSRAVYDFHIRNFVRGMFLTQVTYDFTHNPHFTVRPLL